MPGDSYEDHLREIERRSEVYRKRGFVTFIAFSIVALLFLVALARAASPDICQLSAKDFLTMLGPYDTLSGPELARLEVSLRADGKEPKPATAGYAYAVDSSVIVVLAQGDCLVSYVSMPPAVFVALTGRLPEALAPEARP